MLTAVIGTAFWWTLFVLVFRHDRRKVRNGLLFLIALYSGVTLMLRFQTETIPLGDLLALATIGTLLLGVLSLGLVLIANGLTMVRKEGRSLGNALSLLAGIALYTAPVAAFALAGTMHPIGIGLGVLLGFVCLHLGAAFLIFFSASVLYQLFPKRLETDGIIVHGSQLIHGRVPALLRSRLDRGVRARRGLLEQGVDPLLVPSGGKGPDEHRTEGEAMADYLVAEAGVPAERVHAETESRTTEENLIFSHRILDRTGHRAPYLICTSRYHAFRAALIARRLGYDDEAVGGRTAAYFVPSATLREFAAVMTYRKAWNIAALLPSLSVTALIVRAAILSG